MAKKKNPISRDNYLFIALLGFITIVIILLFFSLFSADSQIDEVTKANCFAAASKGECDELASEYGGEIQSLCCKKHGKCCP